LIGWGIAVCTTVTSLNFSVSSRAGIANTVGEALETSCSFRGQLGTLPGTVPVATRPGRKRPPVFVVLSI